MFALFTTTVAIAIEGHDHGSTLTELHLNNGAQWQTNDIFKKNIANINKKLQMHLKDIHQDKTSLKTYKILAEEFQSNLDTIISTCKFSPDVDEQVHLILLPILDGITLMSEGKSSRSGAIKIIQTLELYDKYFDHPGWNPIKH